MEGGDFGMTTIDERVVSMKFNNGQFLSGIKGTLDGLSSLKRGLNLDASKKSLEGLNAAGKNFSLAPIGRSLQPTDQHLEHRLLPNHSRRIRKPHSCRLQWR